jgi:hypothetical protein
MDLLNGEGLAVPGERHSRPRSLDFPLLGVSQRHWSKCSLDLHGRHRRVPGSGEPCLSISPVGRLRYVAQSSFACMASVRSGSIIFLFLFAR